VNVLLHQAARYIGMIRRRSAYHRAIDRAAGCKKIIQRAKMAAVERVTERAGGIGIHIYYRGKLHLRIAINNGGIGMPRPSASHQNEFVWLAPAIRDFDFQTNLTYCKKDSRRGISLNIYFMAIPLKYRLLSRFY
jgi:hypothetical protein